MSPLWLLVTILAYLCCAGGGFLSARTLARGQAQPEVSPQVALRRLVPSLALSGLGTVGVLTLYAQGFQLLAFVGIGIGVVGSLVGTLLYRPKLGG